MADKKRSNKTSDKMNQESKNMTSPDDINQKPNMGTAGTGSEVGDDFDADIRNEGMADFDQDDRINENRGQQGVDSKNLNQDTGNESSNRGTRGDEL